MGSRQMHQRKMLQVPNPFRAAVLASQGCQEGFRGKSRGRPGQPLCIHQHEAQLQCRPARAGKQLVELNGIRNSNTFCCCIHIRHWSSLLWPADCLQALPSPLFALCSVNSLEEVLKRKLESWILLWLSLLKRPNSPHYLKTIPKITLLSK